MKRLIAGLLVAGMMAGTVEARALQYPPQESNAPVSDNGGGHSSNVVPIVAIAGAVITTGLILFKVHKVKQARKAKFNVYVLAGAK